MIIPLGNRVLVKKIETERELKTNSGLIVGKESKGKNKIVEILMKSESIDEDTNLINEKLRIGDKVIIDQYTGVEIKENEEEFLIIRLVDILGIVK